MVFSKNDLQQTHYSWTDGVETSAFIGEPTRRLFDRFNGEQVLFMINFYGAQQDSFSVPDGQHMEERINNLPLEAKSEKSVYQWLQTLDKQSV